MRSIRIMLIKEFKQIFRTREMVAIIFGMPVIQLVVLGFTITNEVKNVSLIISDRDNSEISREIVSAFEHTDRFTVIEYTPDQKRIEESIQKWEAQVALIIPQGFAKEYKRHESIGSGVALCRWPRWKYRWNCTWLCAGNYRLISIAQSN